MESGEVAELACYVKSAERNRWGREQCGTYPFCDLVHRAGRPHDRGLHMTEDSGWRMLGEALPRMHLDSPWERGRRPRVQMLRKLLQRQGWY